MSNREFPHRNLFVFTGILVLSAAVAALVVPAALAGDSSRGNQAKAGKTGAIAGVVSFTGTPPKRTPLKRNTDPYCAKISKLSEQVVVTDGKLRDVHVRIKVGSVGTHRPPSEPAVVNQSECMYEPRVVGIVEGQKLAIKNSDPTYHNVRGNKNKRTLWNLGHPAKAGDIVRENLGKAGAVVSLHCDVHPWMSAFAVITDHPFFQVTGENGAFLLKNVPTGSYALEAWHPALGLKTTKVKVRAGKTANASFEF